MAFEQKSSEHRQQKLMPLIVKIKKELTAKPKGMNRTIGKEIKFGYSVSV